MPDSVPLMGPCRLLHILGQKKTLRRGEENPIRVFHASRLLHACEQVSYKPLLNPVSSLPLDPLLPKVILPQDNCRALYLYIALASEVLVRLPLSKTQSIRSLAAWFLSKGTTGRMRVSILPRSHPRTAGTQSAADVNPLDVSVRRLIRIGRSPGWRVGREWEAHRLRIGCVDPADHVLVRVEIRKPFVKEDPRESCETFRIFRLFLSVGRPFEVNPVVVKLERTAVGSWKIFCCSHDNPPQHHSACAQAAVRRRRVSSDGNWTRFRRNIQFISSGSRPIPRGGVTAAFHGAI